MVVKFPKKMYIYIENDDKGIRPCIKKEEIEKKLGFAFKDISDDNLYYNAMLPSGWSLVDGNHPNYKSLLDQNGLERGFIHFNDHSRDSLDKGGSNPFANFYWCPRYSVHCDYIGSDKKTNLDEKTIIVYFGNKKEKLYIAGMVYSNETSYYETINYYMNKAREYGDNNYPWYNDIFTYWDLNITKTNDEKILDKHK